MPKDTIAHDLEKKGVSRREFLKISGLMAVAMGFDFDSPLLKDRSTYKTARGYAVEQKIMQAMDTKPRLPVIWMEFQDCAGCSEALTRSNSPTLGNLVLNTLTIEYHETLSAAAGFQIEQARQDAMQKYAGQYILVVEGSIPADDDGIYCTVGGRTALDLLKETACWSCSYYCNR